MIGNLLLAIGVVCILLGVLALLNVVSVAQSPLFIAGAICLVGGYFLRGDLGRRF